MNAPSRRYLSVWLRRLTTDRIARGGTPAESALVVESPMKGALVVVAPVKGALRLCAVNDAAAALGLSVGLSLADARARYPALAVADADPEADDRLLVAVADWCDRYTPLVGLDAPDGLFLDVTGCAHLFGGEAAMGRDLVRRLTAQGFQVRAAFADTVGCAWAVAHAGKGGIVPAGMRREALVALPLAALRISGSLRDALVRVGLKSIGDVIDQPRAPLAARFPGLMRRLDQAMGREEEAITPRLPPPSYVAEKRFPDPIAREEDVLGTIETLARELERMLERRGEGARTLQAALFRTDGKVYRIEAGTSAPLRDAARIRRLFVERLAVVWDECDPGFGYDVVRLSVLEAMRSDPAQATFVAEDRAEELSHLIDRLGARFGQRQVTRLVEHDSHIPEFAVASVPARMMQSTAAVAVSSRKVGKVERRAGLPEWREVDPRSFPFQDSFAPVRPIRLFVHPEPITKVVAQVPDGPPARFCWRRIDYQVVATEGPERIAPEWWRDAQGRVRARDYFRVECREGLRLWLYRDDPLADDQPADAQPVRWFVHGLFA